MNDIPESMLNLDLDDIVQQAVAETGLEDFGDGSFREPLAVLLRSLDQEANLNAVGRMGQRLRCIGLLATRLKTQAYLNKYPEILEEVIEQPVVIAGLPRTGSTMLHRVLASDSRFYAPYWYEVRYPAPELDWNFTSSQDVRIDRAKAEVQAMLEGSPELAAIHPMDALAPDEEVMLLEHSFCSTMPQAGARVPSYSRWVAENDNSPAYEYLKLQLQFLQWQKKRSGAGQSASRWILKAPHHLHYMSILLEVFPDAKIVQTHRDPIETIPSICSFTGALYVLSSDEMDPLYIADEWSNKWARGMAHTMQARQQCEQRFLDVLYKDSLNDPDAVIQRVYDFIGVVLTDEARAAMDVWRDANRRELRPSHEYNMADYGLTEQGIAAQFAQYRAKYFTD